MMSESMEGFLVYGVPNGQPSKAREPLVRLFGPKVLKYAEAAWDSSETDRKIAFCDLAVLDPEVVTAHYENRTTIMGRSGTTFENAFTVPLPLLPDSIVRVWSPTSMKSLPTPLISLSDIR